MTLRALVQRFEGRHRILGFGVYLALVTSTLHLSLEVLFRNAPGIKDLERAIYGDLGIEILISGSSRAALHIDPRILERALKKRTYNLGRFGARHDIQRALLEIYLRENHAPALLIQELDPDLMLEPVVLLPIQYASIDHESEFAALFGRTQRSYWRWRFLPLYRFTVDPTQWWYLLVYTGMVTWVDGFTGIDRQWQETDAPWKTADGKPWRLASEPDAAAALDDIAATAQTRGTQVVFVLTPVFHDYVEDAENFGDIVKQYHEIAERHGAVLLNYADSEISRSRENFIDQHHMNRLGAERFSMKLAARMQELVREGRIRLDE